MSDVSDPRTHVHVCPRCEHRPMRATTRGQAGQYFVCDGCQMMAWFPLLPDHLWPMKETSSHLPHRPER